MQILTGAIHAKLVRCDPAQSISDRRLAIGILAAVADHNTITSETFAKIGLSDRQLVVAGVVRVLDHAYPPATGGKMNPVRSIHQSL